MAGAGGRVAIAAERSDGELARPIVIVDGTPVPLWRGSCWRDAIVAYDPVAAVSLTHGGAWIEDARGEPLDPSGAIVDGAAIFLVRADVHRP